MPGRILAALREARGWSQAELAERAGVTHSTISRLEAGGSGGSWQTVHSVLRALGVESSVFDGGEPLRMALEAMCRERTREVMAQLMEEAVALDPLGAMNGERQLLSMPA